VERTRAEEWNINAISTAACRKREQEALVIHDIIMLMSSCGNPQSLIYQTVWVFQSPSLATMSLDRMSWSTNSIVIHTTLESRAMWRTEQLRNAVTTAALQWNV